MSLRRIDGGRDADEVDTGDIGARDDLLSSEADLDFFEKKEAAPSEEAADPLAAVAPRRRRILPLVLALFAVLLGLVGTFVVAVVVLWTVVADDVMAWVQGPEGDAPPELAPVAAERPPPAPAPAPVPEPTPPPTDAAGVPPEVPVVDPAAVTPPVVAPPVVAPVVPVVEAPPPVVAPTPAGGLPPPVVAPEPPAPKVPKVEELVVSAEGASRVTVKCSGATHSGTTSARLASFPAGFCSVEVQWGAESYRMGTTVEQPLTLQCALVDGVLRCA